jgi:hypothetical protein
MLILNPHYYTLYEAAFLLDLLNFEKKKKKKKQSCAISSNGCEIKRDSGELLFYYYVQLRLDETQRPPDDGPLHAVWRESLQFLLYSRVFLLVNCTFFFFLREDLMSRSARVSWTTNGW